MTDEEERQLRAEVKNLGRAVRLAEATLREKTWEYSQDVLELRREIGRLRAANDRLLGPKL